MSRLRVQNLGAAVVFLLSAAGPAKPQSPGPAARNGGTASAFTFRVTQATVTRASQNILSGLKLDPNTGGFSLLRSLVEPKNGRVFVLLKVVVRNDGAHADRVAYKNLVIRGENRQPIPYMVLVSDPQQMSVPMYTDGATASGEVAPNASKTEDLLLDAPSNFGAMALQYGSLPAVPIGVSVPSWLKPWWAKWYYLASIGIAVLIIGAIVWLAVRRRGSPEEPADTLGLR
jgi:hypothetical protein